MDPGEMTTGTRDEHYNLVSVLYHALHGAETTEAYILDAEAAGDERLATFFSEVQVTHREMAERAKELLGLLEVPPEPKVAPDIPPESAVTPGAVSEDIPAWPAGDEPADSTLEFPVEEVPPEDVAPGGVPPRSADVQRESDVRTDEIDVAAEEVSRPTETPGEPGRATPERRTDGERE
jgi:hypothetical protein